MGDVRECTLKFLDDTQMRVRIDVPDNWADGPRKRGRGGNWDPMEFSKIQQGLSQNRKGVAKSAASSSEGHQDGQPCNEGLRELGAWRGHSSGGDQWIGALGTSRMCHLHRDAWLEEQQRACVETGKDQTGNREKALTSWGTGSLPKELKQSVFLGVFNKKTPG